MSRRQALQEHMALLGDIRNILAAMKNISLMETRKLTRYLDTQRRVVETLEAAAGDFLHHHPAFLPRQAEGPEVVVLIGSERGFCGDFNTTLVRSLERHAPRESATETRLVIVGQRLMQKMADDPRVVARLPGTTVIEELDAALARLVDAVQEQLVALEGASPFAVTVLYHAQQDNEGRSRVRVFRPLQDFLSRPRRYAEPPRLLLHPARFMAELIDHYMAAVLYEVFYSSLMAENRRRLAQMQGALQRLDKQLAEGKVRMNMLRQEEITEEIEVIMLSSEALAEEKGPA